jgi:hypothetical protein
LTSIKPGFIKERRCCVEKKETTLGTETVGDELTHYFDCSDGFMGHTYGKNYQTVSFKHM